MAFGDHLRLQLGLTDLFAELRPNLPAVSFQCAFDLNRIFDAILLIKCQSHEMLP